MSFATNYVTATAALALCSLAIASTSLVPFDAAVEASQAQAAKPINLAERLAAGKLRAVNREATKHQDSPEAVYVAAKAGNGVVWVDGADFADGTIEVEVRGRDVFQQSFLGIAFHGKDDSTYEAVYLRPFNFRADDPVRRQHAVQYMALPDYDWPRLRKEFPEEFENPVDQSIVPTDWVPLRMVASGKTVQIFVGPAKSPTLEVRKLGAHDQGLVGLWTGNNSDGGFRNLRITPAK
jgi:hypothetical protein